MISLRVPVSLLLLVACADSSVPAAPTAVPGEPTGAATEPAPNAAAPKSSEPKPDAGAPQSPVDAGADAVADAAAGPREPITFELLTYNVAGLPQGVSGSDPAVNTAQISPLLEPFELVLVQEDFTYHSDLVSQVTHPYQTETVALADRSDGLNMLSRFVFTDFTRTTWNECNGFVDQGSDCLTKKGFSRAVVDFGQGRLVDVYDVHFDAGKGDADRTARQRQAAQLTAAIAATSAGHALIVAGDTNMRVADEDLFTGFLAANELSCACRTLACPESARIDRVLYRSAAGTTLTPLTYALEEQFVDADGERLSDHLAVGVTFEAR